MKEKLKLFPNKEVIPEKRPKTLDIIKINGRWAQVSCDCAVRTPIRYLDTNESEIIYWDT